MNPVDQLLADLQAGAIETSEALAERIAALTDSELAEFEAAAVAMGDGILDGSLEVEGDRVAVVTTLADAADLTRGEAATRIATAEQQQAELEAQAARLHPVAETEPPADGGEDAPAEPEAEPAPAGDPAPEAEPQATAEELQPQPVAASALPRIGRVSARRPAEQAAPASGASEGAARLVITAAAEVPGYAAGQEIPDFDHVVEALSLRADALRRVHIPEGGEMSMHVATFRSEYPEDQRIQAVQTNPRALAAAVGSVLGQNNENIRALTAAGGFCAPAVPLYDQLSISSARRPARDALPSFNAERGRVQYVPSPRWTDYTAGVRRWTSTNDTEALNNANVRKPCVRVDCDDAVTTEVDAITMCATVGNFFDRTYPERRDAILEGLMAWQARFAERRILTIIGGNSTNVSAGQTLGTARDVLATLDRLVAGFRSRWRVEDEFRLEYWGPRWLRDMIRTDLVRALPASGSTLEENLAVADATINAFFAARNLNVTWLWDGEDGGTDQEFGAEAGGSLQNWPSRAIQYVFPPGQHVFLDAGRLDLGIVRDSTLNATNDLQIWSETFEGVMSPGLESFRIDMDLCPSGEVSGTADITPLICTTGS